MRLVVDGTLATTERAFHDALAGPLDFGPYYGNDLSALWDRLSTDVERPVELVWTDSAASREPLGDSAYSKIARVLTDVMERDAARPPAHRFVVRFE
ncbi:barstar family protein [Lentzea sp. DG1S-22]|uniref:barstar family protein n=1 Tax=Lentzea sp. DG1S-22 TaxID=3108822 RepID=UPI002E77D602|nr:barstar family protein [Lentzea sp. DG1S-22]WVH78069.1 barstar family protein [Lentzea sp. DG1S-22]